MRTFIAIDLPDAVKRRLGDVQRQLDHALEELHIARSVRWTTAQNLHLTLRFLGDTTEAQRDAIQRQMTTIARPHATFALALHQLGCFPNWRRPNIVWVDFTGDTALLQRLQGEIEQMVCAAGFPAEGRPFTPHLTIGRVSKDASTQVRAQLGEALQREQVRSTTGFTPRTAQFAVAEIAFMQSELHPSGSVYTRLAGYSLKG